MGRRSILFLPSPPRWAGRRPRPSSRPRLPSDPGSPIGGAHLSGPPPTSGRGWRPASPTAAPASPAFPAPRRPRPSVRPPSPRPSTPSPARPRPRDGRDSIFESRLSLHLHLPHVGWQNRAAPGHVRPPLSLFKHHRPSLYLFPHFTELPRALLHPSAVALLSAAAAAALVATSRR
uniref:Uncharacterized protein n=1 Tax=Oryza sativa subsp. japonica TaxID=39947 RepID=Q6Z363_ORYSJ|nr:hypothetical protein [Oryza sativa Japonica Group]